MFDKMILSVSLFAVLLIGTVSILPVAEAVERYAGTDSSQVDYECRTGQVLVFKFNANNQVCTSSSTAERWVELGIAEIVRQEVHEETMEEETVEDAMEDQTISSSVLKYIQEPPTIDPEKGYFVVEIADGLYWLNDFAYQVMFLTTGEGVIVVDAPPSMGENILNAIAEVTDEPVTHVIYSHIHKDHIGAANIFPDTVTIIAHKDTATHLAMKNDPGRPVPTITFDDTYTLSVGDQILELSYVGAFHSKGDILIYAPQQKVLMAVDIFHPSHAPFKNFAITTDINNYILVHDKMLEYDFDAIISGHQQILGTSDDVKTNKEFTLDVLNNTIQGFQTWDFMEVAQQYGSEGMLTIFSKYIDLVTSTCVDLTLEKWDDRLSDVSVFVEGNCDSMFFYGFID